MRIAELLTEEHDEPLIIELLRRLMSEDKEVTLDVEDDDDDGARAKGVITQFERTPKGNYNIGYWPWHNTISYVRLRGDVLDDLYEIRPHGEGFLFTYAD